MIPLASIVERFEADYFAQYGASALPSHAKALNSMKRCRNPVGSAHAGPVRRLWRTARGAAFLWPSQLPALPSP